MDPRQLARTVSGPLTAASLMAMAVAIEVRILVVKNGSILDSQTFEANSSKRDFGIGGIGFGRGGALGGGVSSTNSPELDSVANQTVVVAIGHVTNLLAKDAITSQPAPPPPPK